MQIAQSTQYHEARRAPIVAIWQRFGKFPARNREWATVGAICLVYFVIQFGACWLLNAHYGNDKIDSALYQNALWQASQFNHPLSYILYTTPAPTHPLTGLHFMPIGFAYGLIYRILPGIQTTSLLYAAFFTLAGIFVYAAARRVTGHFVFSLFLLLFYFAVYLPTAPHLYPIDDFATAYIAGALCFYLYGRYRLATVAFLFAAMSKEYYGLSIAAFGAMIWLIDAIANWRRTRSLHALFVGSKGRWGLVWVLLGGAMFVLGFFVIMPTVEPKWVNGSMFTEVGGSPGGLLESLRANPLLFFDRISNPASIGYLFGILAPGAFLALIGFEYFFALIPTLLIYAIINGNAAFQGVLEHYTVWMLPFVAIGAMVGLKRSRTFLQQRGQYVPQRIFAVVWILMTAIALFNGLRAVQYHVRLSLVYAHTLALHSADIRQIGDALPVDSRLGGMYTLYFANRDVVTNDPQTIPVDFIIEDAFADSIVGTLERGLSLGLKFYNIPSRDFYDPQKWNPADAKCSRPDFKPIKTAGSVMLCRKDEN